MDNKVCSQEAQHSNSRSSRGTGCSSVQTKKKEARHSNTGDNKTVRRMEGNKEAKYSYKSNGAGWSGNLGDENWYLIHINTCLALFERFAHYFLDWKGIFCRFFCLNSHETNSKM